jgi:hypothetical protein
LEAKRRKAFGRGLETQKSVSKSAGWIATAQSTVNRRSAPIESR